GHLHGSWRDGRVASYRRFLAPRRQITFRLCLNGSFRPSPESKSSERANAGPRRATMRTAHLLIPAALATLAAAVSPGCGSATTAAAVTTSPTPTPATGGTGSVNTSSIYSQFGGAATVSLDATTGTVRTTDVPNHPTPYWGAASPMYEPPQ